MSNVELPVIGQEPWGEDLNAFLAMVEAETDTNTAKISTNTAAIAANTAKIADLEVANAALAERVALLEKIYNATGRWQGNTQAGAIPGGQQITSDSGDIRNATWMRFAKLDQTNNDMTTLLARSISFVAMQQNDSTAWARCTVTGLVTVESAYVQVPMRCDYFSKPGIAWTNVVVLLAVVME